jgi:hypothetical protein
MDALVHTSGRFKKVASASRGRLRRVSVLALRPGDLVQFYEQTKWSRSTHLLHSAVHVGAGLYVERPDPEVIGEHAPYRLATFDSVAAPVLAAVNRMARVEVLRAVAPLDPPWIAFPSAFAGRLADLERTSGRVIGHQIVPLLEHGQASTGTGEEHLSAVVEIPLRLDEHGRAALDGGDP